MGGQGYAGGRCGDFEVSLGRSFAGRSILAAVLFCAACQVPAAAAERVVLTPAATRTANEPAGLKTAIFAGGCYWGVEGVFSHVQGVTSAVSGFHGGDAGNARYDRVSDGNTGHAESVRITYDPRVVRYDQLLRIFFSVATNPTELNRQGPDQGTQYRNALVPLSGEQRAVAEAYLAQLRSSNVWGAPIATRIEAARQFFPAARDHQDFMLHNPDHGYITYWDAPKVQALQRMFPGFYKASFTTG
jgi:peptide-methionine (S)-S-oxide reductase